jgi:hypothetical protein
MENQFEETVGDLGGLDVAQEFVGRDVADDRDVWLGGDGHAGR